MFAIPLVSFFFSLLVALRSNAGHDLLIVNVYRSHKRHTTVGWSELVINSSQRHLSDNTQPSQEKRPCSRQDSNPHSQKTSGCRCTPETARPLGSALVSNTGFKSFEATPWLSNVQCVQKHQEISGGFEDLKSLWERSVSVYLHANWHIIISLEASVAIAIRASGFVMCAANNEASEP